MLNMFSITLPIFLLIGLGYLSIKTRLVKPEALPSLGSLVLYFTLPATVFSAISQIHLSEVAEPYFVLAYGLASLLTLGTGLAVSRWVLGQDMGGSAIRALGMALPNSIFIGYPILLLSLHDTATIAFVLAVLVENLLILPIVLILLEYSAGKSQANNQQNVWKIVGLRIVKNPLIISIAAGIIASLIGLPLPKPLAQTLDLLARASAALALLFVGATLATTVFKGNHTEGISWVIAGKLALHPALAALLVWLLPAFDPALQKSVIIITAVPMLAIYPIIGSRFGYHGFCSKTLLMTTAVAFFSLAGVLWWVG